MIEWKLLVQEDWKLVDELPELLSRMVCLKGMVHDSYPELCQGLIVHVARASRLGVLLDTR